MAKGRKKKLSDSSSKVKHLFVIDWISKWANTSTSSYMTKWTENTDSHKNFDINVSCIIHNSKWISGNGPCDHQLVDQPNVTYSCNEILFSRKKATVCIILEKIATWEKSIIAWWYWHENSRIDKCRKTESRLVPT